MASKRPTSTEITRETARLRSLPIGQATTAQIDDRIKEIRNILAERAQDLAQLTKIIDQCIKTQEWVPAPAVITGMLDAMQAKPEPFWQPPAVPERTIADVLEDMRFQQNFKLTHPHLAQHAQERLIDLESELRWLECGEAKGAETHAE